MSEFTSGAALLDEAIDRVEMVSRLVARESAKAPQLTRSLDALSSHRWRPPVICSMEELTTAANEIAAIARQVTQYAAWLRYEGETP